MLLAEASILTHDIKESTSICLVMRPPVPKGATPAKTHPEHLSSDEESDPCRLYFQRLDIATLNEYLRKSKTVYFVRHGESLWNEAQDACLFYKMPALTDAPLSRQGKRQCESLQKQVHRMLESKEMKLPPVIFCSPLTRAIQTAVIGFQELLCGGNQKTAMVLMPSAREKKNNVAAVDSSGIWVGSDIITHVQKEMESLYRLDSPSRNSLSLIDQPDSRCSSHEKARNGGDVFHDGGTIVPNIDPEILRADHDRGASDEHHDMMLRSYAIGDNEGFRGKDLRDMPDAGAMDTKYFDEDAQINHPHSEELAAAAGGGANGRTVNFVAGGASSREKTNGTSTSASPSDTTHLNVPSPHHADKKTVARPKGSSHEEGRRNWAVLLEKTMNVS